MGRVYLFHTSKVHFFNTNPEFFTSRYTYNTKNPSKISTFNETQKVQTFKKNIKLKKTKAAKSNGWEFTSTEIGNIEVIFRVAHYTKRKLEDKNALKIKT